MTLPSPLRRRLTQALMLSSCGLGLPRVQAAAGTASDALDALDTALVAAINGAHRSDAHRARDAARRPLQTLRFFGLAPEHTVVEAAPGGGWYTEFLAPLLRERGLLVAAHFAADSAVAYEKRGRAAFEAKLAANPAVYDRVALVTLPKTPQFEGLAAGSADRVLTFRNLHNWISAGHLEATLQAFFAVLKPGGMLGVVEHRAAEGTPDERAAKTGYVTEAYAIAAARRAGFVLDARSEVNANPRDTRDHPGGVWSLPPSFSGKDVDRARFAAIGESDRMTLRFVKPLG